MHTLTWEKKVWITVQNLPSIPTSSDSEFYLSFATIGHFKFKPAQLRSRLHKANIWPSWVRNSISQNPYYISNTLITDYLFDNYVCIYSISKGWGEESSQNSIWDQSSRESKSTN